MPGLKIVDGGVSGFMAERLFLWPLEIVDVQHLARTGGFGKARQQTLSRRKRHVLALAPADRFRLERLDPAAVIGHVRAVHGAQRNAHRLRDRGLRHSALAQQHHLDALALRRRDFPSQRCFQLPDLLLGALDHPSPRIRQPKRIISRALMRDRKTPKIPRFKQLWKRYEEVESRVEDRADRKDKPALDRSISWDCQSIGNGHNCDASGYLIPRSSRAMTGLEC